MNEFESHSNVKKFKSHLKAEYSTIELATPMKKKEGLKEKI
jgi:hypothetical protein